MKKLATVITFSSLVITANGALTAGNLLAYYDFNGDANDLSGNGANGTLTEGAVISADGTGFSAGAGDSALDLGTSQGNLTTINQPRSVSNVNLTTTTTNNSIAISFWAFDIGNGAGGNAATSVFGIVDGATGRGVSSHLPWSDGNIYFDHNGCCDQPGQRLVTAVGTSLLNDWHHFVLQIDSGSKQIWVDGNKIAENLTGANALPTFTGEVKIGAQYDDINSFGGRIDEFAIWNVALEPSEIQALAGGASALSLIPEPSSTLLVLMSGLLIVRRRR